MLVSLRLPSLPVSLRQGCFRPNLCKKVVTLGLASFLTYALDSAILIIMNTTLQCYGGPGEGNLLITCATIAQSHMLLIATPMSGITLGCQGVVSFKLGASNRQRVEQALRGVLLLCLGFAALMLAVTQLFWGTVRPAVLQGQGYPGPERRLHQTVHSDSALHGGPVDGGGYVHRTEPGGASAVLLFVPEGLFITGILLFPLLFSAPAAFAAEPFCDIVASCLSGVLFLHYTPKLLDVQCGKEGCVLK